MNKYGVEISGPDAGAHKPKLSSSELLCQLKEKVQVTTLTSDLRPFSLLPWAAQLPLKQLSAEQGPFKSCAVVSSAGSLRKSGLGNEIGEDFLFLGLLLLFCTNVKLEIIKTATVTGCGPGRVVIHNGILKQM